MVINDEFLWQNKGAKDLYQTNLKKESMDFLQWKISKHC